MSTLNPFLTQRYGANAVASKPIIDGSRAPPQVWNEGDSDDGDYDIPYKPSVGWSSFQSSIHMVHKVFDPLASTQVTNKEKAPQKVEVSLDSIPEKAQSDIEKLISQTRNAMEAALAIRPIAVADVELHHRSDRDKSTSPFCCTTTEMDEPKTIPDIQTRRVMNSADYSPQNITLSPDKKVLTDKGITFVRNEQPRDSASSPLVTFSDQRIQSSTTRALSYEPTYSKERLHTSESLPYTQLDHLVVTSHSASNTVSHTPAALEELTVMLAGDSRAILAKRVLRRMPLLVSNSYTDGEIQSVNFGWDSRHTDEYRKEHQSPSGLAYCAQTSSNCYDGEFIVHKKKSRSSSDNQKKNKSRKRDIPGKRSRDKKRKNGKSSNEPSRCTSTNGIPAEALGVILSSIYAFATDEKRNKIAPTEVMKLQNEEDAHQQELLARKRALLAKQDARYTSYTSLSKNASHPTIVSSADFPKVNIPKSAEPFFPIPNSRPAQQHPQQRSPEKPAAPNVSQNNSATPVHRSNIRVTNSTPYKQSQASLIGRNGGIPRYLLPTESWLSKGPELQGVHLHESDNTKDHQHHWEHSSAPITKRNNEDDGEINSHRKTRQSITAEHKGSALERLLRSGRNVSPPLIKHSYMDVHSHQVKAFNNNAGNILKKWIATDSNNKQ